MSWFTIQYVYYAFVFMPRFTFARYSEPSGEMPGLKLELVKDFNKLCLSLVAMYHLRLW